MHHNTRMCVRHFSANFQTTRPDCPIWACRLRSPSELITAYRCDEVRPVIRQAESAARRGHWVVVLLDYGVAPAFDTALEVRPREEDGLPLACAAIFDRPDPAPLYSNSAIAMPGNPRSIPLWNDAGVQRSLFGFDCDWRPLVQPGEYATAFKHIREYIAAGDVYQVNFTFPLAGRFKGDPAAWFYFLTTRQPAAYHAYIELDQFRILSFSPELFFTHHGDQIRARPMKGTCPRGRWLEEDQGQAARLLASEKDRAENLMIVDLLRNDLGRLARPGSVRTKELFALERHPTLWQMTSTIQAKVRTGVGLEECLAALFPCGSVTGAPKVRAMQIIAELEAWPRGLYTGAIGLVQPGGNCLFTVAIRTLVLDTASGQAIYGVGSGVTHDSEILNEYAECRLKAAVLTPASQMLQSSCGSGADSITLPADNHFGVPGTGFELLETMRLAEGRYYLLRAHLRRLKDSAEYFGYPWRPGQIAAALSRIRARHSHGHWRVRLTLNAAGEPDIKVQPIPPSDSHRWLLGLAPLPVDSADAMLYHKTTQRGLYERAAHSCPNCNDVLLWNERREITESTIANLIVELDDGFYTPPVASGVLPGILRGRLLAQGRIRERVISIRDLRQARNLYLVNSVRGWVPAQLSFHP
jgi:para-aminobenzoate synthetase / 4-amino-4-deoxychorismate lyase